MHVSRACGLGCRLEQLRDLLLMVHLHALLLRRLFQDLGPLAGLRAGALGHNLLLFVSHLFVLRLLLNVLVEDGHLQHRDCNVNVAELNELRLAQLGVGCGQTDHCLKRTHRHRGRDLILVELGGTCA